MPPPSKPLKVIEAIHKEAGPAQEKSILEPFLQMMELGYEPLSVDNRKTRATLKEDFLDKFLFEGERTTPYKYIHIAAHGDGDHLLLGPELDCRVTSSDIHEHRCGESRKPLDGALITVSACGSLLGGLEKAFRARGASSVIRPLSKVEFDESAMFTMLFYFMLGQRHDDLHRLGKAKRIAAYVDLFQRTKMSYLNIGGTGTWRMDYWIDQGSRSEHEHVF